MSTIDYSRLNGRMAEMEITLQALAHVTKMTKTTFSLKLKSKSVFKQSEIGSIVTKLNISTGETDIYFFTPKVWKY